ncbi:MAG TPA: hypothetical protein VNG33_19170 [Polyangiaceae bacterium]|nr:hypothetical protein [Polyangiaceae bacterium]
MKNIRVQAIVDPVEGQPKQWTVKVWEPFMKEERTYTITADDEGQAAQAGLRRLTAELDPPVA